MLYPQLDLKNVLLLYLRTCNCMLELHSAIEVLSHLKSLPSWHTSAFSFLFSVMENIPNVKHY